TVTTNGVDQDRTANAQNELTQVGAAALAYSTTGNLTTDAQGRTLAYDAWNRLVAVNDASAMQVARYEYDGMNRRIVEQVGTSASPAATSAAIRDSYYSQEWQVLEERIRDAVGSIPATADTRYIWSPVYIDAMVARDRNADSTASTGIGGLEERVDALQDANWNTTALVAATGISGLTLGNVFTRFVYTPYGESQTLTASWGTPAAGSAPITPWSHLFQGLKLTDVTGLAYVRHRDYSPTLGRFIERDPIGFEAGDNNWYRFVANGPTGRSDPSGLDIRLIIGWIHVGTLGSKAWLDVSLPDPRPFCISAIVSVKGCRPLPIPMLRIPLTEGGCAGINEDQLQLFAHDLARFELRATAQSDCGPSKACCGAEVLNREGILLVPTVSFAPRLKPTCLGISVALCTYSARLTVGGCGAAPPPLPAVPGVGPGDPFRRRPIP
ncbi:MAG: hypothetical protein EBT09_09900, partial [Actinobacteria bacterium]|nr:hypothetical protein [Actinomycetota bacterium]